MGELERHFEERKIEALEKIANLLENINSALRTVNIGQAPTRHLDRALFVDYFNNRILRLLSRFDLDSTEKLLEAGRRNVALKPGIGRSTLWALDMFMYESHNEEVWFRQYNQIEGAHLLDRVQRRGEQRHISKSKSSKEHPRIPLTPITIPSPFEDFKDIQ